MLSTVAERIYWTARYLERVESTARLVSIYDKLLFDLPRSEKLGWYNLIEINSLEEIYGDQYSVRDERNVIKFMLGDQTNPSSVLTSLMSIRENVRTSRDVIPGETWELVNELTMYVQENLKQGINRSKRHEFLDRVIQSCQQIMGFWFSTMPRDEAWAILSIGLNVERADMTSRNLDAGMATLLEIEDDDQAVNSHQIILGTILRAVGGDQSYRRSTRSAIKASEVISYLLSDTRFPRSLGYCLERISNACGDLPKGKELQLKIQEIQQKMDSESDTELSVEEFRDYLNRLQIRIGSIHHRVAEAWFIQQSD